MKAVPKASDDKTDEKMHEVLQVRFCVNIKLMRELMIWNMWIDFSLNVYDIDVNIISLYYKSQKNIIIATTVSSIYSKNLMTISMNFMTYDFSLERFWKSSELQLSHLHSKLTSQMTLSALLSSALSDLPKGTWPPRRTPILQSSPAARSRWIMKLLPCRPPFLPCHPWMMGSQTY